MDFLRTYKCTKVHGRGLSHGPGYRRARPDGDVPDRLEPVHGHRSDGSWPAGLGAGRRRALPPSPLGLGSGLVLQGHNGLFVRSWLTIDQPRVKLDEVVERNRALLLGAAGSTLVQPARQEQAR